MQAQEEILKEARGHFKAGRESSGLGLLREVIRRGQLDPEGIEKAGRALKSR